MAERKWEPNIEMQGESQSIREMIEVLQKAARGDLSSRVPVGKGDSEQHELARSINQLIEAFHQRSESELLQQKLFFENILNKFPIEVVIFNPEFSYIFVNPTAVKDATVREWLIGKNDFDYCRYRGVDESIAQQRWDLYNRVKKAGKPHAIQQNSKDKEGKDLYYLRILNPVVDERGEVEMFIGYGFDISELKEKENLLREKNQELEAANTILDQYVYRASHDMRAPLTSLMGLINIVRLEAGAVAGPYLDLMERTITKLDSFISSIVDNSRNTREGLEIGVVNLTEVVESSLKTVSKLDGYAEAEIETQLELATPLHSDAQRISVIVGHLLSNAIKYRKPEGKALIHLSLRSHAKGAELEVRDNGMGIPEEHQSQVFDMFFRATHHAYGSGMGLYIVKETLKKLEGTVELESTPGVGSRFRLFFPQMEGVG